MTKRFGDVTAIEDLSFGVRSGSVTGFLGPNGAGKSTALKAIAGLIRPTAGRALINGAPIESRAPDPGTLGVHIEACGAHPGRTARDHLRSLAALAGGRAQYHNGGGRLLIAGMDAAQVGDLAHDARVALHEVAPIGASLEDVFFSLTAEEPAR